MKRLPSNIDPEVLALAEEYLTRVATSRAAKAIRAIMERGSVTTDDLSEMGYEHPPRAIGDVRDQGIPVVTRMEVSASGRRMARYSFGNALDIRQGQTGRTSFPKKFRQAMLATYGPVDCITLAVHEPRSLQIDHRIPYRISGDEGLATNDISAFMFLDSKSQRQKSFSCESCENFQTLMDASICRTCFWAYPESYEHVAMRQIRRVDVVWQGREVSSHDELARLASEAGTDIASYLKELGRRATEPE